MKVTVAKSAGFCFGVKTAVDGLYNLLDSTNEKIYTFGPIIHNENVISDFSDRGVRIIDSLDELKKIKGGIVVIRSHGVGKEVYDILASNNIQYKDLTCPFVKKIHHIVNKAGQSGRFVLVAGDSNHPEVAGILGWCDCDRMAINSLKEAKEFRYNHDKPITMVSQTTFNHNKFKDMVEIITKKGYDMNVIDTICNATEERQREARELSSNVDTMLVVGSRNSSNTQKLFEVAGENCSKSYLIESWDDLDQSALNGINSVGITAGASTPNKIIEEVQNNVRRKF